MRDLIRANLGLLCVSLTAFIMMGAGQSLYGPALPAFTRSLALADGQASWLISAHWLGCGFGVAAMYVFGARIGPRHAVGAMAIGAAVVAVAIGWWTTLLGALIFGAGYGCATVVFNPRVLVAFGARGPAMVSLINASFGIGAIASPLAFVALGSNPVTSFAVVAVIATVIWLVAGGLNAPKAQAASPAQPFNPRFGLMLFAVFGIGLEACLIGLGPTALIATGQTEDNAATLLSGFFVAFLCARVALVFIAHRIAPFTLFTLAMAGAAICAIGAITISAPTFFVATGGFAGLFFPGFYVAASRVMGTDPRVAPTIIAAGLVGGIPAPVIMSGIMGHLGTDGFFWIVAAVATIVATAAITLGRPAMRA
jgi:MFS transporter, FHS family, glucose/mannose:H+ symporter